MLDFWENFSSRLFTGGVELEEGLDFLMAKNMSLRTAQDLSLITEFDGLLRKWGIGECYISGETITGLSLLDMTIADVSDESLIFTVNKKSCDNTLVFFTEDGLRSFMMSGVDSHLYSTIYVFKKFTAFASRTTWFLPWNEPAPKPIEDWGGLFDPRKLSRDLTGKSLVPSDIRPWILFRGDQLENSSVFIGWKEAAIKFLSCSMCSELELRSGMLYFCSKGEKSRSIPFVENKFSGGNSFDVVHKCAEWIFEKKEEAESKHAFLNYHVAINFRGGDEWPEASLIECSFVDAQQAYRLHLQKTSKELLRSLADLRKSLYDEVSRVSQNTTGLISNLWRDFALAAISVALNITQKSASLGEANLRMLTYGTVLYLLSSYLITILANSSFARIGNNNRKTWHAKVYAFLDTDDYNKLVRDPIEAGLFVYRVVAYAVGLAYLITILILINIVYPLLPFFGSIYTIVLEHIAR